MKMRAHHAYCSQFQRFTDPSRKEAFEEAVSKIEKLHKEGQEKLEMVNCPDFLCQACSFFNGQECAHPSGGETGVRKWDARILEGTGLAAGQVLTFAELKSLVQKKAPLDFCRMKCPYYLDNKCDGKTFRY